MTQATKYLKDYQKPTYSVETVDLIFELDEEFTVVKSQLHVRSNNPADNKPLVLNGEKLELISVAVNGQVLSSKDYQVTEHNLIIPNIGAQAQIDMVVKIKPQENTSLMGLYKSSGNFCTQCEPEGFRKITYYVDRPDNLAIFTVTIVADKDKYPVLLSNGNNIDSGESVNNKHWFKWHDPHKKSPHLFALVAGALDVMDDEFTTKSGRKVKLRLFVEPGNLDQCQHAMDSLKWSMKWDEDVYGREYDLDIFMTVAVSDFNMGAMENKGLNIFNTKYILANQHTATDADFLGVTRVVGHEYFHNWSGNRVGCRDWFQLSLKEGFTVFRDQNFTADISSQGVKRVDDVNVLRTMQFKEDSGPMSHPIRPASYIEINNFYTVTVYEKGAEVIRMLHTLLGAEKFRRATDLYFSRFDGKAVTTDDFVNCMQEISGLDLSQFCLWYSQSGTPLLNITDEYDAKKQCYLLHVTQITKPTADQSEKHALHIPLKVALFDDHGKIAQEQILHLTNAEQTFEFNNVIAKPTPSLLRGFSAPVNLEYPYSEQQLQLLLKHDNDPFARWEAGQVLARRELTNLIAMVQNKKPLSVNHEFINTFKYVLLDEETDKEFLSLLLVLPNEAYIADQMAVVDPLAIHQARQFLLKTLAQDLHEEFLQIYQRNTKKQTYDLSHESVGQRSLKNICLKYLMLQNNPPTNVCFLQYEQADNMTDKYAAFNGFVDVLCPERETVLTDFYKTYQHDALVVDKWFASQASSNLTDTFEHVKQLMRHHDFTLKNPNKVRALISTFTRGNPGQFHAHDGKPYIWLADLVIELNALNPQIASRLVEPLLHWKRFSEPHKTQMYAELQRIAKEKLSPDVYEVVTKSLLF